MEKTDNNNSVHNVHNDNEETLLATAIIRVRKSDGSFLECRALIDQGATISLITDVIANKLQLHRLRDIPYFNCVNNLRSKSSGKAAIKFRSRFDGCRTEFNANVTILPKITSWLPSVCVNLQRHFTHLRLADPHFDTPGPIDVLLSARVYKEILLGDVQNGVLLAQETRLGYILSGGVTTISYNGVRAAHACTISLENEVKKFWSIEDKGQCQVNWSNEEQECELFYQKTTRKESDGRYKVRLPFKKNNNKLGRSRHIAISNFLSLERKFRKNPSLKIRFNESIYDYILSGHAVVTEKPENYYLRKNAFRKRPITKLSPLPVDTPVEIQERSENKETSGEPNSRGKEKTARKTKQKINIPNRPLRRSPRLNNPSTILSIIIALFFMLSAVGAKIQMANLTNEFGIHFLSKGYVHVVSSTFNYIVQIDSEQMQSSVRNVNQNVKALTNICEESFFICNDRSSKLRRKNDYISDRFRGTIELIRKRPKRVAPVVLGAVAGITLAGVATASYLITRKSIIMIFIIMHPFI